MIDDWPSVSVHKHSHKELPVNTAVRGILYDSVWVVVWGVASSLVDWVLLSGEVYEMGSFGQVATFIGYGAACSVLAVRVSGRFLPSADDQADG